MAADIEAPGLSFILGVKIPYELSGEAARQQDPGEQIPDAHVFTQPWARGARRQTA